MSWHNGSPKYSSGQGQRGGGGGGGMAQCLSKYATEYTVYDNYTILNKCKRLPIWQGPSVKLSENVVYLLGQRHIIQYQKE